jgi:hypothetical protein
MSRLQGSLNLYEFSVRADYVTAEECLRITRPLKDLLLSCPNLCKLSFDIHVKGFGCVWYSAPNDYCGLGLVSGESLPPLEELELLDYPWGHRAAYSRSLQSSGKRVIGYPELGVEQDYWANNMDWSRPRRLTAHDASLAYRIALKLTALDEVSICPYDRPRSPPILDQQAVT